MRDTLLGGEPLRTFRYKEFEHPADQDGTPTGVASEVADDLEEAGAIFGRHVYTVCQQVRSGFLSQQLDKSPGATPEQLAELWDRSDEALACVRMIRTAKAVAVAVKQLRATVTR
jgi:hypothetical protein